MDDLARHPHLRRIEVKTPNGVVNYPAPAAIVVGEPRRYWGGARDRRAAGRTTPRNLPPGPKASVGEEPDLDHLRQWIGRRTEASDTVTAQLVKGLRATLFLPVGEPKTRATPRPSRCTGAWRRRW